MIKRPSTGAAIVRLLGPLLLLASTFPYVQIVPSSGYTQPQAFILATFLFLFSFGAIFHLRQSDRAAILGLSFIGLVLFIITCLPYDNSQEYRYLLAYLSPLLMVPAFIKTIQKAPKQTIWILQASIFIWLFVSAVQFLINPLFATSLLGRWGNSAMDIISSGRGVLGLAPEPTHNAFHILLLGAALSLLDNSRLSRLLIYGCIISAVFLAASSSATLALFLATIVWFLRYKTIWGIIMIAAGLAFLKSAPLIFQELLGNDARLTTLLNIFIENPTKFLTVDYSVNVRLGGLWATLTESLQSGWLPNGLSHEAWLQARIEMLRTYNWLLDISLVGPPSGFGLLIFQGGFLVIPFLFLFARRLLANLPETSSGQIIVITVPFIFLSQFYLSSPLFSLIYAGILYRYFLKETHKYNPPPHHTASL